MQAVESLLAQSPLGPLHTVVVDNSCEPGQRDILEQDLPQGVELICNARNVGFGRACNQVFERTEDEFFLLINPDAYLLPQALRNMQDRLMQRPDVGAVSPQAFWDQNQEFYIPPAHDPRIFLLQPELARCGAGSYVNRLFSRLWLLYSLRVWRSTQAVQVRNLCGGHALLRRIAVDQAGGLFDPRFFLYFEDCDLFVRMRQAGYKLLIDPRARVVHHYDQCDTGVKDRKRELMDIGLKSFGLKHTRKRHLLARKLLAALGCRTSSQSVRESVVEHPDQIHNASICLRRVL